MLAAAVRTWRMCTSVPQTVTIKATVKLNSQFTDWGREDGNPDILNFECLMESVPRITARCWQLTFESRWSENLIWPITPITLLPPLRLLLSEYTSSVWVHTKYFHFSQIRIIRTQSSNQSYKDYSNPGSDLVTRALSLRMQIENAHNGWMCKLIKVAKYHTYWKLARVRLTFARSLLVLGLASSTKCQAEAPEKSKRNQFREFLSNFVQFGVKFLASRTSREYKVILFVFVRNLNCSFSILDIPGRDLTVDRGCCEDGYNCS